MHQRAAGLWGLAAVPAMPRQIASQVCATIQLVNEHFPILTRLVLILVICSPQDRYDEWFPRFLRIHREVEKEAAKRDKNFSPPPNKLGFKLMHEVWKELPEETLEKLKTIRQHFEYDI